MAVFVLGENMVVGNFSEILVRFVLSIKRRVLTVTFVEI